MTKKEAALKTGKNASLREPVEWSHKNGLECICICIKLQQGWLKDDSKSKVVF